MSKINFLGIHLFQHVSHRHIPWRGLVIDEETLEIRAIEGSDSNDGDAPILPDLLDQIPSDEGIDSVTADGAYDSRKCHQSIAARGAAAVAPPRTNKKPGKPGSPGATSRNKALRASKYPGRAIWQRWSGHHSRSRVGSKMNFMKLLGHSLIARDFDCQVAELQLRIDVLNGDTTLGIPVTVPVG